MRLPFLAPPPAHDERRARIREEAWHQLRSHIEWADYAWNGFIFAAAARDVMSLRERLRVTLELRGERLEVIAPPTPAELGGSLPAVLAAAESGQSVWVECLELDDRGAREEPWTRAWLELLARANERRDRLRGGTKGGVLFVGLWLLAHDVRAVAPDLWSARGFTLHVPASPRPSEVLPQLSLPGALFPSSTLKVVEDELDRQGAAPTAMRFELLVRAAAAALAKGRHELASDYARQARDSETASGADVQLLAVEALLDLTEGDLAGAYTKVDAALERVSERLGRADTGSRGSGDGAALAKSSGELRDELRVLAAELSIHLGDPDGAAARVDSLIADAEARDPDTDLPVVLSVLDRAGRAHLQRDELERAEGFLRRAERRLEAPRSERERARWVSLRGSQHHASILAALARTLFAQGREAEARATARRAYAMGNVVLVAKLEAGLTLLRSEWPEPPVAMEDRERHQGALAGIIERADALAGTGLASVLLLRLHDGRVKLWMIEAATFDVLLLLADARLERDGEVSLPDQRDIVRFADSFTRPSTWTWSLQRAIARLTQTKRADDRIEPSSIDEAAELCTALEGRGTFVVRWTAWCARAGVALAHSAAWPSPSTRSRAAIDAILADAPGEPMHRDAFTDVLLAMCHRFHDAYTTPLAIACASKGVEWASAFASSRNATVEDFDRVQRFFQLWAEAYYGSEESRRTGIQILRNGITWARTHGSSKQCDASIEMARTELRLAEFLRASRDLQEAQVVALSSAARARKLAVSSVAAREILTRALALAGGYGSADRDAELLSQACEAAVAWVHADPWSAAADPAQLHEHWRRNEMPAVEWCAQLHAELALTATDPARATALHERGWSLHEAVRRAVRSS